MQKYYQILGISQNASVDDVKKAYRKLALKYHPDRNKQLGASERFRAISEAYQAIIAYKETGFVYIQQTKNSHSTTTTQTSEFEYYQKLIRERQAKEKHEFAEYMKTDRYKFFYFGEMIAQLLFLLPVFFIFLFFVYKLTQGLSAWRVVWIAVVCFIFYGLIMFLRETEKLFPFVEYGKAIWFFTTNERVLFLIPLLFSIIVFFIIGMNTFLPTYILFSFYFLSAMFLIYRLRIYSTTPIQTFIAVTPLTFISLFLLINFVFAAKSKSEFYKWYFTTTYSPRGGVRKQTLFELENNAYEKEWHTRWPFDFSEAEKAPLISKQKINSLSANFESPFKDDDKVVEFKIANGLFGIPVLKDLRFLYVTKN